MRKERGYHHGNLRRELIDAALRLFEERGDLDFTLRELARAVGVTHNAPYRHFANRAELLAAIRDEGLSRLVTREQQALASAGSNPKARVHALGEAYVRFAIDEPVLFKLVLTLPVDGPTALPASGGESYRLLETTLAEGQTEGALRGDLTSRELALVAWALVHGLASLVSSGRLPSSKTSLARYTKLCSAVFFEGASLGRSAI